MVSRAAGVRGPLTNLVCVPAWSALVLLCSAGIAVFHAKGDTLTFLVLIQGSASMQHFCVFPRSGLLVGGAGSTLRVWRLAAGAAAGPLSPRASSTRRHSMASSDANRHNGSYGTSSKLPPNDVRAGSFVQVASHSMGGHVLGVTALTGQTAWQPYSHLREVVVTWDMLREQGVRVPPAAQAEAQRRAAPLVRAVHAPAAPARPSVDGVTLRLHEGLRLTALPDTEQVLVATSSGFHLVQPVQGLVLRSIPLAPPSAPSRDTGHRATPVGASMGHDRADAAAVPLDKAWGASQGRGAGGALSGSAPELLAPSAWTPEDSEPLLHGRTPTFAALPLVPLSVPTAAVAAAWPRPSNDEALDAVAAVHWLVARHIALPSRLAAAVALVAAAVLDEHAVRESSSAVSAGGLLGAFSLRSLLIDDYFGVSANQSPQVVQSGPEGQGGSAHSDGGGLWDGISPAATQALVAAARSTLGIAPPGAGAGNRGRGGQRGGSTTVDVGVKTVSWEWAGCTVLHMPVCAPRDSGTAGQAPGSADDGGSALARRAQFPHLTSQFSVPGGAVETDGADALAGEGGAGPRTFSGIVAAFDGSRLGRGGALPAAAAGAVAHDVVLPPGGAADLEWVSAPQHMVCTQSTPLLLSVGDSMLHVHRLLPETDPPPSLPGQATSVQLTVAGDLQTHTLKGPVKALRRSASATYGGHPLWPVPLQQGGWDSVELPSPVAPDTVQSPSSNVWDGAARVVPSAQLPPRAPAVAGSDAVSVSSRSGSVRSRTAGAESARRSRVKPAHFFFNSSRAEGMSDTGSVSTASVRQGEGAAAAQGGGIQRILQGSLGSQAASQPMPIATRRAVPTPRSGVPKRSPPTAGSSHSSSRWGESAAPSPLARPPLHPHTAPQGAAHLPRPAKCTGAVRSRLVQQLPLPGLRFVLQCPEEAGHRAALQHWEQRQLAARRLARRVLAHLRIACGASASGRGDSSAPLSGGTSGASSGPAHDDLSAAFDDLDAALDAPLSYAAAAAELGIPSVQLQAVHSAERVFLVTDSHILAAECTLPLSQVADLMTQQPPNFREALWLCDAFVGTRLGGGLDHDQVRKWRERHAYERFAAGAFASAFRHLWRSRHPIRRVLSLVPQLLPRGVALRRVLPHAMSVRLLMEDSLPLAMPHLLAFLGRWRAALQRRERRSHRRALAARSSRGAVAGTGGMLDGVVGGRTPHAGGVWRWLLSDGASKGCVDHAERAVEGGGGDDDAPPHNHSLPSLAELRDVSDWSVGVGPGAFLLPESIQREGPLQGGGEFGGGGGGSSEPLGPVQAAAADQRLDDMLQGAHASSSKGTLPSSIALGSTVTLPWLVDTCLVNGLVWQWLHCQRRLELAARVAATEAVIRKMAPEQLAAFQDRVGATGGGGSSGGGGGSGGRVKRALLSLQSRAPGASVRGGGAVGRRAVGASWAEHTQDTVDAASVLSGSVSGGVPLGRAGQTSALAASLARAGGLPVMMESASGIADVDDAVSIHGAQTAGASVFSDSGTEGGTTVASAASEPQRRGGGGSVYAPSTNDADSVDGSAWGRGWGSGSCADSDSDSDSDSDVSAASWSSLVSMAGLREEHHQLFAQQDGSSHSVGLAASAVETGAMGGEGGLPEFDLRLPRGTDPLWASFHEEHSDCNEATAHNIATDVMAPFIAGVRTSAMYVVAASAHAAAVRAASSELHSPRLAQQRHKCSVALFRLLSKPHSAHFSEVVSALSRSRQWRPLCAMLRCAGQHATAVAVLTSVLRQHCNAVRAAKTAQTNLQRRLQRMPRGSAADGSLLGRAAAQATQQSAAALAAARRRRMRLLRALIGYLRQLTSPHELVVYSSIAPLLGEQLKMVGVSAALSVFKRRRGAYNSWLQAPPAGPPPVDCCDSLNPYSIAAFLLTGRTGVSLLPAARALGFAPPETAQAASWSTAVPRSESALAQGVLSPTWDGQLAAMAFLEHLVELNTAPPAVHMALSHLYLQCMEPLLLRQRPEQWMHHMHSSRRQMQSLLQDAAAAAGEEGAQSPPLARRTPTDSSCVSEEASAAALQCVWAAPNPGEETHALLHRLRVRFLHFLNSSAVLEAGAALQALHGTLRRVQTAVQARATAESSGPVNGSALQAVCLHAVLWDLAPERVALHCRLGEHRGAVEVLAFHQRDLQGAVAYADGVAGDALRRDGADAVSLEAVDDAGSPAAGTVYDALVGALQLAAPLHDLHTLLCGYDSSDTCAHMLRGALEDWGSTCRKMSLSTLPGRARFLDGVSLLQHQGTHSTVACLQNVLVPLLTASAARASSHAVQLGVLQASKANAVHRCWEVQRQLSRLQLQAMEKKALQGAGQTSAQYAASLA